MTFQKRKIFMETDLQFIQSYPELALSDSRTVITTCDFFIRSPEIATATKLCHSLPNGNKLSDQMALNTYLKLNINLNFEKKIKFIYKIWETLSPTLYIMIFIEGNNMLFFISQLWHGRYSFHRTNSTKYTVYRTVYRPAV